MLSDSELRADRDRRADRQQMAEVATLRRSHHMAWVIDREFDTIAFKDGRVWLCDNKFTDNDVFYIDSKDIAKGLDQRIGLAQALDFKVEVGFRIDIHFARHRSKNRKYILFTETDRGWSLKVTRHPTGRITQLRVKKGATRED